MSSSRIDLTLDDSGLQSQFGDILDDWSGHREAMLVAIGEDVVGRMKRDVPTNTSRLKGTIRVEESLGSGVSVVAGGQKGVDYTLPVIEGTEPHPPGSSDPSENRALARWADRNDYPGGFDGIYWSIFHYGTEGTDFVSDALRESQGDVSGIATQVLQNRGVLDV